MSLLKEWRPSIPLARSLPDVPPNTRPLLLSYGGSKASCRTETTHPADNLGRLSARAHIRRGAQVLIGTLAGTSLARRSPVRRTASSRESCTQPPESLSCVKKKVTCDPYPWRIGLGFVKVTAKEAFRTEAVTTPRTAARATRHPPPQARSCRAHHRFLNAIGCGARYGWGSPPRSQPVSRTALATRDSDHSPPALLPAVHDASLLRSAIFD